MKKAIVLVLALVLTLSLAVPAAAITSPVAPETSETTTAPLPEVVESETKNADGSVVTVTPVDANKQDLTKDEKDAMAKAQQNQKEGAEGLKSTLNLFYARVVKTNSDGTTTKDAKGSMTIKVDNPENIVARQFIGGKWVKLKVVVNTDGTVTISGIQNGPLLIGIE